VSTPRIRVAVLGSTGSIGESTLAVLARHPDRFELVGITAHRSVDRLLAQDQACMPGQVVVADPAALRALPSPPVHWRAGREALLALAEDPDVDVVVNALVGYAGLEPTLRALRAGKRVALANKESLVAGGSLVLEALRQGNGKLVPVDSEHSAILQCLEGSPTRSVACITLTASGGPFRGRSAESLRNVRPADALKHPTWSMGAKITIDSATLANKALEVIEAHILYGVGYDQIRAVVHPQSIIHSFVEFVDGSVLAQMGFPTMELPILYALTWPERLDDPVLRTFDPLQASPLTFEPIDLEAFPMFGVGVEAGRRGGAAPTVFNAANEVVVGAFLSDKLSFPGMADTVARALDALGGQPIMGLEDVQAVDRETRELVHRWISSPVA